jgi:RNA polymerase sigma-70 factor (ECF subfamily)
MSMPEPDGGVLAAPDDLMIELARRGDPMAREEIFRGHFGIAYRVAYRLLGHEQDALDAVQDGFLKALLHLGDFDGRSGFRTWVLRIVTNAALDLGRKRRRRATVSLDEGGDASSRIELPGEYADPAEGLNREDLRRAIDAALGRLSPSTRSTFVLFAEAQLSYKEIAECQNVPIGTVMSRLHYARQKLQGFLEGASTPG